MNNFAKKLVYLFTLFTFISIQSFSQSITVSGNVSDESGSLVGVNILVKGKIAGTISDRDGNFSLDVADTPATLVFSIVGYESQEVEVSSNVSDLNITLSESVLIGSEVVVSASRVEQSILESPVTIEKMDLLDIQASATADFMDQLEHMKGVKVSRGSLNLPAINTRGYATDANTRFVMLVDGMDTSSPILNFPTGNLVGINPLDLESVELIPGASSALYGPNAFNGTMLMTSKSPFDYQGLSVQVTQGFTTSHADDNNNNLYSKYNIRYAKAFNDKFAIKVNFAYDMANDWVANDYTTNVDIDGNAFGDLDMRGQPNFNGLNLHGDDIPIPLPLSLSGFGWVGGLPGDQVLDLRRTGFPEEALMEDNEASNMKYDIGINYRINDNLEASLLYRKGGGNTIYTGTQKYKLDGFSQQFISFGLESDKMKFKVYQSSTDGGDTYNIGFLGAAMNEAFSGTQADGGWGQTYLTTYLLALQGYVTGAPAGNVAAAHATARLAADSPIPAVGSTAFNQVRDAIKSSPFQDPTTPGAKLVDNSTLTHADFTYDIADWLLFGANFRNYTLDGEGTVYNQDPDGDGVLEKISINEFGSFLQVNKEIFTGFKFIGSARYDKNSNYKGRVTPRVAAVYTFADKHNLRFSYQTGFRNPDTQSQYIYFPAGSTILLGTARDNAERYGVMEGGAWTRSSYNAYLASGGILDETTGNPTGGNPALLQEAYANYIKPERLSAFEFGYKGVIGEKVLVDANYFTTNYTDFEGGVNLVSKLPTTHRGQTLAPGTGFAVDSYTTDEVKTWGFGLGLTFDIGSGYKLIGNYNFQRQEIDYSEPNSDFLSYFNTPENMYSFTFSNREVFENFGFSASLRFQDDFLYESTFANMHIPSHGALDAQVSYKIESMSTVLKVGGNHIGIGNNDYRSRPGGPFIGKLYYVSLTFDELLN